MNYYGINFTNYRGYTDLGSNHGCGSTIKSLYDVNRSDSLSQQLHPEMKTFKSRDAGQPVVAVATAE